MDITLEGNATEGGAPFNGYKQWLSDPSSDPNLTLYDREEMEALDRALLSQQALMQTCQLDADSFAAMNATVYNEIRAERGLPKLSTNEWIEIYSAGMIGEPVRFFN